MFCEKGETTLHFYELYEMLDEIDLKKRQPLVFAILTDIKQQIGYDAYITLEQFVELLEQNMGNRNSLERLKLIFRLWDEDGNGDIDLFNLVAVSEDLGRSLSNQEAKKIIKRTSMGQAIQFDEFENLVIRK